MQRAIGKRIGGVSNPYTSILHIEHESDPADDCMEGSPLLLRIWHCDWELRKSRSVVCHSELENIALNVQPLVGKTIKGFSWHCKHIEASPDGTAALWAVITFSEDWSIVCYPYLRDQDEENVEDDAEFTVLFAIRYTDKELVFLESGEVKCVDHSPASSA